MAMYQPPPSGAHKHYAQDLAPTGQRPTDDLPPERANSRAFALAAPWALAAWVVVAVAYVALDTFDGVGPAVGWALLPALAGYAVSAGWARASTQAWPSWRYAAVALPVAAVVAVLLGL